MRKDGGGEKMVREHDKRWRRRREDGKRAEGRKDKDMKGTPKRHVVVRYNMILHCLLRTSMCGMREGGGTVSTDSTDLPKHCNNSHIPYNQLHSLIPRSSSKEEGGSE